jgi:hypothetical protein
MDCLHECMNIYRHKMFMDTHLDMHDVNGYQNKQYLQIYVHEFKHLHFLIIIILNSLIKTRSLILSFIDPFTLKQFEDLHGSNQIEF